MSAGPASGIVPAVDLAADAARAPDKALVLLFSQPDCHWCDQVRARYLRPLQVDPAQAARAQVREINILADAPLRDSRGETTTHAAFARSQRVSITPTVVVLRADGSRSGDAIVGARSPDYYQAYLDAAIDGACTRP